MLCPCVDDKGHDGRHQTNLEKPRAKVIEVLNQMAAELDALRFTSLRPDSDKGGVTVRGRFNHIVGSSQPMQELYDGIQRAWTCSSVKRVPVKDFLPAQFTSIALAVSKILSTSTAPHYATLVDVVWP